VVECWKQFIQHSTTPALQFLHMALQDLTPQLRTRLSRMERAVGWFVLLAAALLVVGFVYYVYTTAERKGWFKTKAPYFTFVDRATGLKVGDPVKLMGFDVGKITRITAEQPGSSYNVYIEFEVDSPFYGYLWSQGSQAKVATADFLGKRSIEVTKGTNGYATFVFHPLRELPIAEAERLSDPTNWVLGEEVLDAGNKVIAKPKDPLSKLPAIVSAGYTNLMLLHISETRKWMTGIWRDKAGRYEPFTNGTSKPYWLMAEESAAVTERLEQLVGEVEKALPNVLGLTNQLITVLSNTTSLTSNFNAIAVSARPALSNLTAATAGLDRPGALGEWLLPTNVNHQLQSTLGNADTLVASMSTNLTALVENIGRSLDNLADVTSNLNKQVQANTNMLTQISDTVVHADEFVQGLKHHWLLRSAFKTKNTNAPPAKPPEQLQSPKARNR
jgi:ABC-type transporter Mla subunit MlaD